MMNNRTCFFRFLYFSIIISIIKRIWLRLKVYSFSRAKQRLMVPIIESAHARASRVPCEFMRHLKTISVCVCVCVCVCVSLARVEIPARPSAKIFSKVQESERPSLLSLYSIPLSLLPRTRWDIGIPSRSSPSFLSNFAIFPFFQLL